MKITIFLSIIKNMILKNFMLLIIIKKPIVLYQVPHLLYFLDLSKEYEYDMKDDSFYDYDEESGKSKEDELNDEVYDQLCSDATLLAPDWF